MKKIATLLLFFLFLQLSNAQTSYWILLKDKESTPYSINKPSAYLSEKAIERRSRQNIAITMSDLPVDPAYVNAIKSIGVTVVSKSKWFNAITVSTSDTNKINAIKALPFVKEIKKVDEPGIKTVRSKFESEENKIPVSSERSTNTITTNTFDYGPSFKQVNQIGVDCMHNYGFQGQGITIAVLDAGFYKVDS
jgi:serine protease AprX